MDSIVVHDKKLVLLSTRIDAREVSTFQEACDVLLARVNVVKNISHMPYANSLQIKLITREAFYKIFTPVLRTFRSLEPKKESNDLAALTYFKNGKIKYLEDQLCLEKGDSIHLNDLRNPVYDEPISIIYYGILPDDSAIFIVKNIESYSALQVYSRYVAEI